MTANEVFGRHNHGKYVPPPLLRISVCPACEQSQGCGAYVTDSTVGQSDPFLKIPRLGVELSWCATGDGCGVNTDQKSMYTYCIIRYGKLLLLIALCLSHCVRRDATRAFRVVCVLPPKRERTYCRFPGRREGDGGVLRAERDKCMGGKFACLYELSVVYTNSVLEAVQYR